jgi:Spy/CpxP family protein refolding chaperone
MADRRRALQIVARPQRIDDMHRRLLQSGLALFAATALASGQSASPKDTLIAPPPVPAQSILDLRDSLQLSDAQLLKLRALARTQTTSLAHMTASYLRADADLLDASRRDDIAVRRLALEKRARIGIDGEIARLQGERDARALLTLAQRDHLQAMADRAETQPRGMPSAVWTPLVTPSALAYRFDRDSVVRDSGQVRLKVTPSYAEILIDGITIGTNFKQVTWAVGVHTVTFRAPGCGKPIEQQITVLKGQLQIVPPIVIPGC